MEGVVGDDEEKPTLSESTMGALMAFLKEQSDQEERMEKEPFEEDWGMSQFWYTKETANTVASEVCEEFPDGRIACISCPSLFRELRESFPDANAQLFEYDSRFEVLGNFTLYDYNTPLEIPDELVNAFDVVIADPPYLSDECLTNTLKTVKALMKDPEKSGIYLMTGAVMREVAKRECGLRPVKFRPEHKNKLGNEFLLYTVKQPTARLGGFDDDF